MLLTRVSCYSVLLDFSSDHLISSHHLWVLELWHQVCAQGVNPEAGKCVKRSRFSDGLILMSCVMLIRTLGVSLDWYL
jgi:hypothetical protein